VSPATCVVTNAFWKGGAALACRSDRIINARGGFGLPPVD
jgi:hypothetical protein